METKDFHKWNPTRSFLVVKEGGGVTEFKLQTGDLWLIWTTLISGLGS
jgi:hypothetical protein